MSAPKTQRAAGRRLEGRTEKRSDPSIAQRAAVEAEIAAVERNPDLTPIRKREALGTLARKWLALHLAEGSR